MAKSVDGRLSTIEANYKNLADRMDKVISYIDKGQTWREETGNSLAVIINNQEDFKNYQKKCDADRGIHNTRIVSLEDTRTRQAGVVIGITTVISTIIGMMGIIFGRN